MCKFNFLYITFKRFYGKIILNWIENIIYIEGQLIDSKAMLCNLLCTSKMTVRKALDELVNASESVANYLGINI